tara:strand:- start:4849 stop:5454 length:606 start_codon:yes stop_codon:yes gene_type:complete
MAKDFQKFFSKELKKTITESARRVCVEVMNDLAKKGPAYSGEFSSAWYAVPPGTEPGGPRSTGRVYKYDLRNVPKSKFKSKGAYYELVNGAEYAPVALDLEESIFIGQYETYIDADGKERRGDKIPPVGRIVEIGSRPSEPHIRGNVGSGGGDPTAVSTAELDWYNTYTSGGGMKIALARGVQLGFREGPLSGQSGQGFSE